MPDVNLPANPEVRYEKSDVLAGGVIAFGLGILLIGVAAYLCVNGLLDEFAALEGQKPRQLPPLAARERPEFPRDLDKIPPPRLQKSETLDLADLRAAEEAVLSSYGWVDRHQGIVRIPIDQAMKALADTRSKAHQKIPVRKFEEGRR